MNDEWEAQLAHAMKRVEAPASLAPAIAARIQREARQQKFWRSFAAMAATVAIAFAGYSGWQEHEAKRQEQQLVFALQLTSQKISAVEERLKKSSAEIVVRQENVRQENWRGR